MFGHIKWARHENLEFRVHLHVHILPNIFENYPITRKCFYSIAEQFCYGTESSIPKTEQKYSLPGSIIPKMDISVLKTWTCVRSR
jgi:hypothetical protein